MGRRTWHCGQTAAGISWRKGEPEPAACKTPPQSLKPDHGAIAVDKMGIGPRGNLANFSPSFRSLRLPCCQNGSLFDRSVGGPISLITSSEGTLPSSWTCCVLLSWLSLLRCVRASLSPPSSCCPTFQSVFACTNPVSGCGLTHRGALLVGCQAQQRPAVVSARATSKQGSRWLRVNGLLS